jgi:uncharacterized protein (TIGR03086 family)
MESVELLKRAVGETTRLVDNIAPAQLAGATPCTEWTVRDLINHLTGGATMFAVSAEQGSVPDDMVPQLLGGDNLGDDYKGSFSAAAQRAITAFDDPAALEKNVKLPFGEMPATVALNIAVFDVTTHAADLARATGQSVEDTALVDAALAIGRQMIGPDLRQPGVFDTEQPAPEGASAADRLLAFAGRKL